MSSWVFGMLCVSKACLVLKSGQPENGTGSQLGPSGRQLPTVFQVGPPGPSSSLGDQLAGWHPEARDRCRMMHRWSSCMFFSFFFVVFFFFWGFLSWKPYLMKHDENLRCFFRVSLLSRYFRMRFLMGWDFLFFLKDGSHCSTPRKEFFLWISVSHFLGHLWNGAAT